jgi:methylated-DNA-[protein]-cysteine S-methyltransferase
MSKATLDTPVGPLTLTEEDGAITCVEWCSGAADETPLLRRAMAQLDAYFACQRTTFDLPLRVAGTDFKRAVCDAMLAIPFGETCTYGDIAKTLGAPAQAIGQACGGNPIPVIIHRATACLVRLHWADFRRGAQRRRD